jgi:CTP:molybdopterin cytidylyltransferase MocA
MTATCVVLAAGAGTRMGRPKALLAIDDTTFVARVVETARAAGIADIIIVVGHGADAVRAVTPAGPRIVVNSDPERGQLSSLQLGAALATRAVLAWPVDHPAVTPTTVHLLLDRAVEHPDHIILPTYEDRGGHPTLFPASMRDALLALPADQLGRGARPLIERGPVLRVPVDDPGVRRDIDTPADYERLLKGE